MSKPISTRNNSIDIFRFISALCIVLNHTRAFNEYNPEIYQIFVVYLVRFTVPFFLCTSGYFFYQAVIKNKSRLLNTLKRLIIPYLVWSLIYGLISFVYNVIIDKMSAGAFLLQKLIFLFTNGVQFHLWYFPAIIYVTIICTFLYRQWGKKGLVRFAYGTIALYIIGVFGSAYLTIGSRIPLLSSLYEFSGFDTIRNIFFIGLSFFSLGLIIASKNDSITVMTKVKSKIIFIITLVVYVIEILVLVLVLGWQDPEQMIFTTYIVTIGIFIFLIKHPTPNLTKAGRNARLLAGFIYFIHVLIIMLLEMLAELISIQFNSVVLYITVIVTSIICGYICIVWNNPFAKLLLGVKYVKLKK